MAEQQFTLDGLILAGGRATRLGGVDKGLQPLDGKALIEWTLTPLRPLVDTLIINCNRNHPRYEQLADRVVEDANQDFAGPLHGVLSGLRVSRASHLLVLPCDTPQITAAVLAELIEAARRQPDQITIARTTDGWQPLHVIVPCHYQANLAAWLAEGNAKVRAWYQQHPHQLIEFSDTHAFYNLNSHQELQQFPTRRHG